MAANAATKTVNPLEDLGSLFSFMAENTEYYQPTSQTTTVVMGIKTGIPATIDGDPFEAEILVTSGRLTRLTHMIQTRTNNETGKEEPYNLLSGIISNVTQDLWIKADGEMIPHWEYIRRLGNAQAESHGGTLLDEPTFLKVASNVGFDWAHERGGRPMFFHHMGASQAGIQEAFELLLSAGGKDATGQIRPENRNRIQRAVTHPGLEVLRFEIGRANREKSQTGQGYLDPVDAEFENYLRAAKLRTQATIIRKAMQQRKIDKDPSYTPDVEKQLSDDMNKLVQQAASWSTNLGGAQQRKQRGADGEVVTMDQWFAQHVPCGRILVNVPQFEPAFAPPAEGETEPTPLMQGDGVTPVMKAKLTPEMDDEGQPVMNGDQPKYVQVVEEVELDFWRRDDSDVPTDIPGITNEIDTTAAQGQTISVTSGAAPAGTGSVTGEEEPF